MKRAILLLTATVLLITTAFSGCAPKANAPETPTTPYQKYMRAADIIREADSVAARTKVDFIVTSPDKDYIDHMKFDAEARWLSAPEAEVQMEMRIKSYEFDKDDDEGDNGDFWADIYQMYYRDGYIYTVEVGYDSYYQRNKADEDFALSLLKQLRLELDEADVVSGSVEQLSGGEQINLTLSSKAVTDAMENQIYFAAVSGNLYLEEAREELKPADISFGDLDLELVLNAENMPVSCTASFNAKIEMDEETYKLKYIITLDDIRMNTLSEIRFPRALNDKDCYEDYEDYSDHYSNYSSNNYDDYGDYDYITPTNSDRFYELREHENSYYNLTSASFYPEITNTFGDDCKAAYFLSTTYLDELFWLMYQTQCGVTAPATPAGFTDPAQITTEGLARLFMFDKIEMIDFYVDYSEKRYYLPDAVVEKMIGYRLPYFVYEPETLNGTGGFSYENEVLMFPFSLGEPEYNYCRVETAEVISAERVKLTATGFAKDLETPVNKQELVMFIDNDGNALCESYTITAPA